METVVLNLIGQLGISVIFLMMSNRLYNDMKLERESFKLERDIWLTKLTELSNNQSDLVNSIENSNVLHKRS